MSQLINIERDMFWANTDAALAPTVAAVTADASVNTSGTVAQRVNSFMSTRFPLTTAGTVNCVGCLILPPADGDVTPYRFIGSYAGRFDIGVAWGYGWFDSGTADDFRIFDQSNKADSIVAIPPLDSTDPNYGRPLAFFGMVNNDVGWSNVRLVGSVQRLISKPPQYASAVS